MSLFLLSAMIAVIVFCRIRINKTVMLLTEDQRVRLKGGKISTTNILVFLIIAGVVFIEFGGLPFRVSSVIYVVVFVVIGIWIRLINFRRFKYLKLPRAFINAVTGYQLTIHIAMLVIIMSLLMPTKAKSVTYTCPNVPDLLNQLQFMAPGESKWWSDNQSLVWTISIPSDVVSPPIIRKFIQAKWNESSHALICRYSTNGSNAIISVFASFDAKKTGEATWREINRYEFDCEDEINKCGFVINAR